MTNEATQAPEANEAIPALVSTEWLAAHLDDPQVRIADVRWYLPTTGKVGRNEYAAGHLPGAVFVDLDSALAAPRGSGPGRHPLPAPEAFAATMAQAGISGATHVVAYDDSGGSIAARLWWLLRYFGHERVSVLDGGIARWQVQGRPTTTEVPSLRSLAANAVPFVARPHPEWVVDKHAVDRLRADPSAVVMDARAAERYEGKLEPVDARPGHIPGARSAPFAGNLRAEPGPRLKPVDELRARYDALGVPQAKTVVAYCGSGVTACHTLLAMHMAGYPAGRLYEGSWSDWSSDPALPAASGPEPG